MRNDNEEDRFPLVLRRGEVCKEYFQQKRSLFFTPTSSGSVGSSSRWAGRGGRGEGGMIALLSSARKRDYRGSAGDETRLPYHLLERPDSPAPQNIIIQMYSLPDKI